MAIDDTLLDQARAILKTRTVRATIERALLEVLRRRARHEEVEALATREGMDLAKPEVMSKAWRR